MEDLRPTEVGPQLEGYLIEAEIDPFEFLAAAEKDPDGLRLFVQLRIAPFN